MRRVIAVILVLSLLLCVIPSYRAEAVVPVAGLLADIAVSAGLSFASSAIANHFANHLYYRNLTDEQRALLQAEGGLSELTVDEVLRSGRIPPAGTTRVIKMRPYLISGALSALASVGTTFIIDYFTKDEVQNVDGINVIPGLMYCDQDHYYNYVPSYYYIRYNLGVLSPGQVLEFESRSNYSLVSVYNGSSLYIGGEDVLIEHVNAQISDSSEYVVRSNVRINEDKSITVTYYKSDGSSFSEYYFPVSSLDCYVEIRAYRGAGYPVYSKLLLNQGYNHVYGQIDVGHTDDKIGISDLNNISSDPSKVVYIYYNDSGDVVGKDIVDEEANLPLDVGTKDQVGLLQEILLKVNSIANTLTSGLIGDLSSIHFPEVPSITDKFPFSLPWDFARLIGLLYANPECPRISADLGYPFDSHIDIDLSVILPEEIMSKVRLIELIAFAVALVILTRRLLGGAE